RLHVERSVAHHRVRVPLRVLARRNGDVAEVLTPRAVLVHVAVRPHPDDVDGADEAPRHVQRLVVPHELALLRPWPRRLGAAIAGTVADHGGREPARDRGRGVHERRARRAATVRDLVPPAEALDAEPPGDRHLVRRFHLEHRHAVDVLRLETGVVEGELDRLDGGVGDRAADVLREGQVADADDRDAILDAPEEIVPDVGHQRRRLPRVSAGAQTVAASSAMASSTDVRSNTSLCPAPATRRKRFGSRAAANRRSPSSNGTMSSASPWTTSSGTETAAIRARESKRLPTIAASGP